MLVVEVPSGIVPAEAGPPGACRIHSVISLKHVHRRADTFRRGIRHAVDDKLYKQLICCSGAYAGQFAGVPPLEPVENPEAFARNRKNTERSPAETKGGVSRADTSGGSCCGGASGGGCCS